MSKNLVLSDIDSEIRRAVRDIATLRRMIDEKTAHIDRLGKLDLVPYFVSDLPVSEWQAIGRLLTTIGTLKTLKLEADKRKHRPRRKGS